MSPSSRALLAAWWTIPAAELWFARRGFVGPAAWQVGFEVAAVLILSAGHVRFARSAGLRSPLLPGLVALALPLCFAAPGGALDKLVHAAGAVALLALGVRFLGRLGWRPGLVAGIAGSLACVTAARLAVLSMEGAEERTAVADPLATLVRELRPIGARGSGSARPRLALVTIDTLRWDHLTGMESWRRLAARGRTWERAMSTSSWTLPAMASILTGLLPSGHGATARVGGGYQGIAPGAARFTVELADAGYTNAAVFTNGWLVESLGFREGFHRFWHVNENRPHVLAFAGPPWTPPLAARAVVDRAVDELGHLPPTGAFLWVHFVDPHLPYDNAADALGRSLDEGRLRGGLILDEEGRERARTAYTREVELLDRELLRLFDALEADGWFEDGVVILTADHGEELWDHGGVEHGHSHHGEVVDVGLALVAPDVPIGPGAGVASVVDVPATLRAVAGLPAAGPGLDLRQAIPPDRTATAWGNAYFDFDRSARSADLRVIVETDGRIHAYDLAADPRELRPIELDADHPLVRAALAVGGPGDQGRAAINTRALQALGYL